jgi:hypothetical protein
MPGCEHCSDLDGKHFKVSEMEIGKNAPPLHPNCRCSIAPYEDSAEYDEWLENLENGGTTEEWEKQKAVEKNDDSDIIELKIDELTPCLRRLRDNKIVDTEVFAIKPQKDDFLDWEFDWTIPAKSGHSVYAIKAKGDERIQGLVALKSDARNIAFHVDIVEAAPFNNPHNKNYVKKEYSGVGGHLFAEAVRQSYEAGFGGAVYFTAKSDLIEHYQKELGAVLTNPRLRLMFIDEVAAKKLYERYYGGE